MRPFLACCSLIAALCGSLYAQSGRAIVLDADLSDASRKLLHAKLTIPVEPGPLTLYYAQWIPGEHTPTGPIDNLAGLVFTANGERIRWRRDDVNMFALHLDVPAGATEIEARLDYLDTAPATGFSGGASTTENLALMSWNSLALYPAGKAGSEILVEPSVKVPPGWHFGTALTSISTEDGVTRFRATPLNQLIDSPVLAGRFFKEIPLAEEVAPKHFLDMAADGPEDLKVDADMVTAFSNLVREAGALYASRHYDTYHFLLTLSDSVAHFGLEHHQSSDDRVEARNFLDDDLGLLNGDLLPHEFTHSWNGKYRRPAGLISTDYQHPMKGELLWVYEGLTQYLGEVLAARSGIWTAEQFRSHLADTAAEADHRPGRTWRDLEDTAVAAQLLYTTNPQWDNWRRGVDYYDEGALVWLEADTTIRKLSGGKRSINDFCARFLGVGGNTPPRLLPYGFDDVVAGLNAVQPYDWAAFFRERLTSNAPHAPLGGITAGGYKVEYSDVGNEFIRADESRTRGLNAWYSLGFSEADDVLSDVLMGSPAFKAGLGPGMRIIAVNGRRCSTDVLRQAIRDSKNSTQPMELIVENTDFFRVVKIDYHGGERFPHLVRQGTGTAYLDEILKPLTKRKS